MPFEITMPQLGLTMEKGTVVEWLVSAGDPVRPGQEIFQVETDKAVIAVEARDEGIIARILVPAGEEVPVGTVLAVGAARGEALPADWPSGQPSTTRAVDLEAARRSVISRDMPIQSGPVQASWKARRMAHEAGLDLRTVVGSGPRGRIVAGDVALLAKDSGMAVRAAVPTVESRATPVAANLAAALGLDLAGLTGSGPQGQITQSDVLQAAAAIIRQGARAGLQPRPAPDHEPGLPQVASAIPLKGVRRIVSEGMAASVHTTARVTLFREVNVSEFIRLRGRFVARGLDVSYNDLLVRICATALREHPGANARLGSGGSLDGAQIEHLDRVNVGLAVDTDRGLLVPVVHDADRLTIPQIAAESARLVEAARAGRSLPDDLSGGTFTITNLGMLGVEGFTPAIHLPECCILGVGRIVRKPVVCDENDTVAVRPMMTLSLVFDHRVIDGAPAARFLDRIAQLIEDPVLLLLPDD
jgi:pyruvate dehydrogenase E2 component (dihydrolipoamide acetyltransferase)